jgi:hypothetical protein
MYSNNQIFLYRIKILGKLIFSIEIIAYLIADIALGPVLHPDQKIQFLF